MDFLAIDIGSSYIKHAVLNLRAPALEAVERLPMPQAAEEGAHARYELSMDALTDQVRAIIRARTAQRKIAGIVFSVQMHGFLLWDEAGHRVGDFATWQDMRALRPCPGGHALDLIRRSVPEAVLQRNGTCPLPPHSVAQVLATLPELPAGTYRLSLLGDALLECLTGQPAPIHETNACATGMYDVFQRDWNHDMIRRLPLAGVCLPTVSRGKEPAAHWREDGQRIPMYTAIGDQQAAILGAMPAPGELMINIATGSQLIYVTDPPVPGEYGIRPLLEGQTYRTVSHLPAGRSLNVLMDFLVDAGKRLYGHAAPDAEKLWETLRTLETGETAGLTVNLSFFEGERRGSVDGINESNLRIDHLFAAAYVEMAREYRAAFDRMKTGTERPQGIVLAGGIPRKSPALCQAIAQQFQTACHFTPFREDALVGLLRLALLYAGEAQTMAETLPMLKGLTIGYR